MMPVHYFYNPSLRRRSDTSLHYPNSAELYTEAQNRALLSPKFRESSLRRKALADNASSKSSDSEDESDTSPLNSDIKRSRSFGCIYRFFGLSDKESDANDTDTDDGPVYANDLERVKKSSNIPNVPVLIDDICSIIEDKYLCTEGLYSKFEKHRKLRNVINMAKFHYDRKKLDEMEPRILAGLLKSFLKGLRIPVLGVELAGMIITIGNHKEIPNAKKMRLFARQKKNMSEASQATLYYLLQHFNKVLLHKKENKLTLNTLCSNFASSFFPAFVNQYDLKRNPAPMQFLVVYNDLIFPSDVREKYNSPQHTGTHGNHI